MDYIKTKDGNHICGRCTSFTIILCGWCTM